MRGKREVHLQSHSAVFRCFNTKAADFICLRFYKL